MNEPPPPELLPELLIVGHVTRDLFGGQERPGGAAWYAARAASVLGVRAGVVTAAPPGTPAIVELAALPGIEVACQPSAAVTTFAHELEGGRRRLTLVARGEPLRPEHVPAAWRGAAVTYLGPVAGECDRTLVQALSSPFVAVGLQGWLRAAGRDGAVEPALAPEATDPPPGVRAAVLSIEDHPEAARIGVSLARRGLLVAITRGAAGATLLVGGAQLEIPPAPAREVDPTGAGDVFGLVWALAMTRGADARAAATVAAGAAACVVEGPGIGALSRLGLLDAAGPGAAASSRAPGGPMAPFGGSLSRSAPKARGLRPALTPDRAKTIEMPAYEPDQPTKEIPPFGGAAVPSDVLPDQHTVPVSSSIERSLEHEMLRRQSADEDDDGGGDGDGDGDENK